MRALLAACFLVSVGAHAAPPFTQPIDLDKPGALAALEKERPEHYRTVVMTLRATERMNCAIDLKAYRAGDMKRACRSHLIRTSYPAQVALSIPVEKTLYMITAYLDPSLDRVAPAK